METLELADFVPYYPGSLDPALQRLISQKYEYNELASGTTETPPSKPGDFYKHQKLTHRYLRNYDRLLLMDEPGTGKTCSVLGFTEYVYDQFFLHEEKRDTNVSHFKRVYVLVSNKATKENFINQLVCRCSKDNRYLTEGVLNAKNSRGQKLALSYAIKNWYRVSTYYGIVKEVKKITKDFPPETHYNKIREHFSDCIFWIDEAHNLTSDAGNVDTDAATKGWSIENTYQKLLEIIQIAERTKVILSTATPMINETREFIKIINLLLSERMPQDLRIENLSPLFVKTFFPNLDFSKINNYSRQELAQNYRGLMPENTNIDNLSLSELEVYVRGKIIFTKALDTGINIRYQVNPEITGESLGITPSIYISKMQPFQANSYSNSSDGASSFYSKQRQASNFVFPDGSFGGGANIDIELKINKEIEKWRKNNPNATAVEIIQQKEFLNQKYVNREKIGFSRYINYDVKSGAYFINEELRNAWTQNGLKYYSCKFDNIVQGIKNSTLGTTFIYSEYVTGSGAIVLGLALEHFAGFRRYLPENNAVFISLNPTNVRSYCSNSNEKRQLTATAYNNIQQGVKHYALITGDTVSGSEYSEIMDIFNSPENWNGQLIKTLIVSRIGRVGINVNNVTRVDLIGPEFNKNNALQANFRALRATGHVDLLKNLPPGSRVDVDIFWHAAIVEELDSSDINMYLIMEEKARKIAKVMRKLKQCNISCHINRERNQPSNLIDYSADCDYDVCNYPCFTDLDDSELDYLTYDLYYSEEMVKQIVQVLKYQIFPAHTRLTLREILLLLQEEQVKLSELARNKKYLILALEQILLHKQIITNRFGQNCYLREDGDVYYLDAEFPTTISGNRALSYYTEKLFVQNILSIQTIYQDPIENAVENILVRLAENDGNLDILNDTDKNLLQKYRANIYQMLKPVKILEESYRRVLLSSTSKMSLSVSKQLGRKKIGLPEQVLAKNLQDREIFDNYDPCTVTDSRQYFVYAHNLRSTVLTTSNTAVGANTARGSGIRRLYDREKKKWLTLYKYDEISEDEIRFYLEEKIYDTIIRVLAKNREGGLPLIRGTYDIKGNDRTFKIINNLYAKGGGIKEKSSGRVCKTIDIKVLYLILYYLNVDLSLLNLTLITNIPRSFLINELNKYKISKEPPFEEWDDYKLQYYYTLTQNNYSKDYLCSFIENVMQQNNLIS